MSTVTALDIFKSERQVAARDLKWRPAVYGIVVEDGKVLLLRVFKTSHSLPGGGVKLGEDISEALVRDIKEGTGFDDIEKKFVDTAEWVPVGYLDDIEVSGTVDFRNVIKEHI